MVCQSSYNLAEILPGKQTALLADLPLVGREERPPSAVLPRENDPWEPSHMNDDPKQEALAAWYKLLRQPEIRMDSEEHYDELLKAADEMERIGLINGSEWRVLVREAGVAFANSIQGVGGGT